jgi:hypothetical protein
MHPTYPMNVLTLSRDVDECKPLPLTSDARMTAVATSASVTLISRCGGAHVEIGRFRFIASRAER